MAASELPPAALAFDTIASSFDQRFTPWRSVATQRRAVQVALAEAFPVGARLVEIGGGTGEDAAWLLERGRSVLMTDAAPAMARAASIKLASYPDARVETLAAEALEGFARRERAKGLASFDGAYSNFAGLNCVRDLRPVARGLAQLIRPGGQALLVVFGTLSPGEIIVETLRRRPRNILRRLSRGDVPAHLGGQDFTVRYHRKAELIHAMRPWFNLADTRAIGLFVPPSAAEPWISRHPHLLGLLETLDRGLSRPLAMLGDHILYRFVRNGEVTQP
jgi:SAM-dependent methyltransferase